MRHYLSRISVSLLTFGLMGLAAVPAPAATRPFHLVEHGTLVPGDNGTIIANGSGNATHLGRITVQRTLTLTPTSDPSDVEVNGEATLTAPGGDQLKTGVKGTLNPATGQAILVYEWEGGTGRFADATGVAVWLVQINPDQTFDVVADGIIDY